MGLFDRFRKPKEDREAVPSPQSSLPSISYAVAYFVLPHYAFNDCDKVIAMFTETPETVGPFFYLMCCQVKQVEPVHDDAPRFRAHHGQLGHARDYFVMEYPTPPPLDLSDLDPMQLSPEQMPVLAPYFSAILRRRDTKAVSYYTLGQAPFGGTTFRSVWPDGANCNHGPGPQPRLDAFLARLRSAG